MPILKQKLINRDDLIANPHVLYLFGDNDARTGYGGQAGEMRDEENAVGVRTKWAPGRHTDAYFVDDDFAECCEMIEEDMQRVRDHLSEGGIIVIPADGLGTGLSQLPERAPRIFDFLVTTLEGLEDL